MKIEKIKIRNYRSINSVDIQLVENTLLVGPNDHGKTNILEAIDDFLNIDLELSKEKIKTDFYMKNKRKGAGSSPLRFSFVLGDLPSGLRHTKKKLKTVAIGVNESL